MFMEVKAVMINLKIMHLVLSPSKESLVVMEATGYYHYRLAQFLFKQNILVSVGSKSFIGKSIY